MCGNQGLRRDWFDFDAWAKEVVAGRRDWELLSCRNFGGGSLAELKAALKVHNELYSNTSANGLLSDVDSHADAA
jgi:hypothetical protein